MGLGSIKVNSVQCLHFEMDKFNEVMDLEENIAAKYLPCPKHQKDLPTDPILHGQARTSPSRWRGPQRLEEEAAQQRRDRGAGEANAQGHGHAGGVEALPLRVLLRERFLSLFSRQCVLNKLTWYMVHDTVLLNLQPR